VAIPTGLGDARNVLVASTAEALIAVSGAFGTLSEIALALNRGTRVVSLGSWHAGLPVLVASSAEEAVRLALEG
jgi:predicted Rossmann-fold nucleotide-binding protein